MLIIPFQNLTEAVFYFRKDVKSTYEYFLFTMPILFAEMGGYIGLLASNSPSIALSSLDEISSWSGCRYRVTHQVDY